MHSHPLTKLKRTLTAARLADGTRGCPIDQMLRAETLEENAELVDEAYEYVSSSSLIPLDLH